MTEAEKVAEEWSIRISYALEYAGYPVSATIYRPELAILISIVAERTRSACFFATGDGDCLTARWEDEEST